MNSISANNTTTSSCTDINAMNSTNNNDNNSNIMNNKIFNNNKSSCGKPKKMHLNSVKQINSSKRRKLSSGMDPVSLVATLASVSTSSQPSAFMSIPSSIVVSSVFDNYNYNADNSTTALLASTKSSCLRSKQASGFNKNNHDNNNNNNDSNIHDQRTVTTSNQTNINFESQASFLLHLIIQLFST